MRSILTAAPPQRYCERSLELEVGTIQTARGPGSAHEEIPEGVAPLPPHWPFPEKPKHAPTDFLLTRLKYGEEPAESDHFFLRRLAYRATVAQLQLIFVPPIKLGTAKSPTRRYANPGRTHCRAEANPGRTHCSSTRAKQQRERQTDRQTDKQTYIHTYISATADVENTARI